MANAINVPIVVSTAGIPKAKAELSQLLAELEKRSQVNPISGSKSGAIESPATRVRQARNAGSKSTAIQTDKDLQAFVDTQSKGLLKKYYKSFNGEELFRKFESGAATITAEGTKPLTDLIDFYERVKKSIDPNARGSKAKLTALNDQIAKARTLQDEVRASLVPQNVIKLNEKAAKAQQKIESFGANLRGKGFDVGGSYLETVTQFIRGVGQNNTSIGDSLKLYEEGLLKQTITPQFFQTGIADLATRASTSLAQSQKNAESLFKTSLTQNAGDYAKTYQEVFSKLLPSGLSSKSNIVDQSVASVLRTQATSSFEKDAFKQLKINKGEFAEARVIARKSKNSNFDIRKLVTELDNVEASVKNRINSVTNQLASLKSLAKSTGDKQLSETVKQLEASLKETIKSLNSQVQLERDRILESARKKAVSRAAVGKPASSSADIAIRKFDAEAKSFDSTLGKITDIAKGSPRGQGATLTNFVNLSNSVDNAINDLVDKKFKGAINSLNAGLAAQGSKTVVPTDLFRQVLDSRGFSGETTVAGRVKALSQLDEQTIKSQVLKLAPGLNDEQLKAVTDQLIAKTQDILQSYRVLDEIVDQINIKRLQELRSAEELAISEGRLADATDLRRQQLFVRGMVPTAGQPQVTANSVQSLLSGLTESQALRAGFSSKLITNNKEDANRRDVKISNAKKREEDAKDDRSRFEKLAAFSGRFGAVMGFLQATVGQVVFQLQQVVDKANELEKTSATIAAVSGSFEKFGEVVRVASIQQQKFGGSLNEQLQGFTSLVQITRRYNVDLEQLDNVARRLAIIDPLQGFSGAAIALKEFFSGDITSLSRRFEIDRKTLNSVKGIADEAERLQKLDEVLANLGISNAVLEARAKSAAAEFDKLSGNFQNSLALLGTGLQQFFLPLASGLNDWLSEFSEQLNEVQLRRERVNEAVTGLALLGEEFDYLQLKFSKDLGGNYFDALSVSIETSASQMDELIKKTNEYVAAINAARAEEGLEAIPLFTQADREFLVLFNQAAKLGLDQKKILEGRYENPEEPGILSDFSPTNARVFSAYDEYEAQRILRAEAMTGKEIPRVNVTAEKLTGNIPRGAQSSFSADNGLLGGNTRDVELNARRQVVDTSRLLLETELNKVVKNSLKRVGQSFADIPLSAQNANTRMQTQLYNERYATQDLGLRQYLQTRPEKGYLELAGGKTAVGQAEALIAKERVDFLSAANPLEAMREFDQYVQVLYDIVKAQEQVKASALDAFMPSLVNPYTEMAEDLGKIVKLSTDPSFGTERMAQSTEFLNSQAKQYNDLLADTVIKQFELAKGSGETAMALAVQNAEQLGIVDTTQEAVGGTRAQLEVISRANKAQALYALEAGRSVSFLQVMNAEANTFNLSMQQIVDLAVEFNKTLSGFNMGTIMPLLSIQDQLDFTMAQLTPGSAINQTSGPRNIDEVYSLGAQAIGLIDQISQEQSDNVSKSSDDLAKLQRDYNEDLAKAEADHRKEMEKLASDYYDEMEKLQRDSEISKRGNKADFYETIFGMDLTNEQRDAYINQYKGYEAEASKLREAGNFTAAEELLNTGSQAIFNQAKYDEEVIQNKEKIKDADEDIADLQKDMAKAKTSDDRAEIQRKINKINQDKLEAENRLKQIEGLRLERKLADDEEIKQAREKEEQITEDYKKELLDRETEYNDKLREMQKAYDKSVEDKIKGDDKATKNAIANIGLLTQLEVYKGQVSQLAKLFATGAPENQIQKQYDLISASEKSILDQAGPLKPAFEKIFASDDTLKASPAQELDPLVAQQLRGLSDNTGALANNTTALTNLVTTLGKAIVGNRLRVTLAP